jgi:hypothetical protein
MSVAALMRKIIDEEKLQADSCSKPQAIEFMVIFFSGVHFFFGKSSFHCTI